VPYFTGEIDSLDTLARPLSCTAFAVSPPLAHGTARSQKIDLQNVTMSSPSSLASGDDNGKVSDRILFTMSNAKDTVHRL